MISINTIIIFCEKKENEIFEIVQEFNKLQIVVQIFEIQNQHIEIDNIDGIIYYIQNDVKYFINLSNAFPLINFLPTIALLTNENLLHDPKLKDLKANCYLIRPFIFSLLFQNLQQLCLSNFNNQNTLHQLLFDKNPQPILIFDIKTYQILDINSAATDLYGYTRDEFLRLKVLDIIENRQKTLFYNLITKEDVYRKIITKHIRKDGVLIDVEIYSMLLLFKKIKCRLIVVHEITEQLNAENLLIDSKRQLSTLLENLPGIVYRCKNDQKWTTIFINERCKDLTGYSASEFMTSSITFYEIILPQYREYLWNKWQIKLQNNETFEDIYQIKTKDGSIKWFWERGKGVFENKDNLLYIEGYIEDITQEIDSERALATSEAKYKAVFNNDFTIMLLIDPESAKILDANPAACKFYNSELKSLKQKCFLDFIVTSTDQITSLKQIPIHKQIVCTQKINEYTIRHTDIFLEKIIINDKPVVFCIVHDITARIEQEQKVQILSKAVENSPVTTVITTVNGIILYANKKFYELTGYTSNEVEGQTARFLKSGYHSQPFYENLWNTILSGNIWTGELKNRKKNGDLYWEQTLIAPITDENGKITHFIGIKEDITEKKQLIDDLIKAKKRAEEADKLKTAFLSNISHEIRTPMNGIIGFAELLKRPNISKTKQEEFIQIIEQSGKRLLNIINDIIEISKIDSGIATVNIKETNINEIIIQLYNFFKSEASAKSLNFSYDLCFNDNEAIILTDETKFQQIYSNLIKNAIKFTEQGSIKIGYYIKDNFIEFYVKDTGIGIPKNYHEMIFDRFRQIDDSNARNFEGSGLGLAIAKGYVELLNGNIWLKSEPGQGSTFYVSLPFIPAKEQKSTIVSQSLPVKICRPIKLLLVEDDEKSAQFIQELLIEEPVTLLLAQKGQEALDLIKKETFDLILMDLKLPDIGGLEVAHKIKKIFPTIPIIAQTAYAFSEDKQKALAAGCDDYISKPIVWELLFQKINWLISDKTKK